MSRSEHQHGEAAHQQQQVVQHRGHLSREARLFFLLAGLDLPQVGELGLGEASLGEESWAPA